MTHDDVGTPRFEIGRVISGTFDVLRRNLVTFGVLSLVLVGLPSLLVGYARLHAEQATLQGARTVLFSVSPGAVTASGLGGLATLIMTMILQGALMHATVQDLNSQPQSVGQSLATGLRNFLPLIGLTILLVIAIAVGFVFLIVPGVMMICAWCVAAPALVAENSGVFGAFSRSGDLTRGHRWQIFGMLLLVLVAEWILSLVFGGLMGVSMLGGGLDPAEVVARALNPIVLVLSAIRATLGAMIGATAVAVLYVELRRAREGEPTGWLAEIFR